MEEIRSFQSECGDWLYGEGVDAPAEKTRERLDKIASMTKPIFHRRDGMAAVSLICCDVSDRQSLINILNVATV